MMLTFETKAINVKSELSNDDLNNLNEIANTEKDEEGIIIKTQIYLLRNDKEFELINNPETIMTSKSWTGLYDDEGYSYQDYELEYEEEYYYLEDDF
jgi:hypothetical protein